MNCFRSITISLFPIKLFVWMWMKIIEWFMVSKLFEIKISPTDRCVFYPVFHSYFRKEWIIILFLLFSSFLFAFDREHIHKTRQNIYRRQVRRQKSLLALKKDTFMSNKFLSPHKFHTSHKYYKRVSYQKMIEKKRKRNGGI